MKRSKLSDPTSKPWQSQAVDVTLNLGVGHRTIGKSSIGLGLVLLVSVGSGQPIFQPSLTISGLVRLVRSGPVGPTFYQGP